MIKTKIKKWRWVFVGKYESKAFETQRKTWYFLGLPIWFKDLHCHIPWHVWAASQFLGGSINVPDMHGESR